MPRITLAASSCCALVTGLCLSLACTPRPSDSECAQMAAHVVQLARAAHEGRASDIAGEVASEHAESLRQRCIEEGTSREVACVIAAESLETVQNCAPTR